MAQKLIAILKQPPKLTAKLTKTYVQPLLQEKHITPSKEPQEIISDSGYNGLSKVKVEGSDSLLPENIKKGENIFGVEGVAELKGDETGRRLPLFRQGNSRSPGGTAPRPPRRMCAHPHDG